VNASTLSLADFLRAPTRFLFFTGKGGVGKTSLACATAVALADAGQRVLLASTDPASNLDEVLGVKLGSAPREVAHVPRLHALNIDPQAAAHEYRERLVGPYRGVLPEAAVRSMEEQLSGACTLEIAAFDEFSKLLGDPDSTTAYDHVVFDTAPTGHTLRLLSLPSAWTGFFQNNTSGTSCLGPLAGLQKQRALYESSVAALADKNRTRLVLVSRPQRAALAEVQRTSNELAALGVTNQCLILNGLFRARVPNDEIAAALERRSTEAVKEMAAFISKLPTVEVPLRRHNLLGIDALRELVSPKHEAHQHTEPALNEIAGLESLNSLVDEIAATGHGVVMTMGKGGVGKTTIAAAIATELARRGHKVHLSTTDPAAHVANAVGTDTRLHVSRIDPAAETRAYVKHVMDTTGASLDADARALLEEDLRSPCTEEIAVFRAFARTVAQGKDGFVVLDTAPTGHTLLLLDATEAYHREVARRASDMPEDVQKLLPRLRDASFTRVLVVTLPEATPVHEAAALQEDLRRAQIEPFGWIVNQSFAETISADPLLRARARNERPFIREVLDEFANRVAIVPWIAEEPVGAAKLKKLLHRPSSGKTLASSPNQTAVQA